MAETLRLLIDPLELNALMAGSWPPVVADCRFLLGDAQAGERAYTQSHLHGAHYLHLDRDLSGPRGITGGRHPLPDAAAFGATLARIGLAEGQLLVAYDDSRGAYAARLWWLARYFGHNEVCLLDGGWSAWCDQGLPVSADIALPRAGSRVLRPATEMVVDFEALADPAVRRELCLIDARDPPRYAGVEEPIDRVGGHIPGAINVPWGGAVGVDGRFLGPAAQHARWEPSAAEPRVIYCGSGVTACVNLFSRALAGYDADRLYPGSWSDWCSRDDAAIATGADPG
jgi:thiosulfate/3-mercaptopyruvate sulfurtransferase